MSKGLTNHEQAYCVTRKGLLAVVVALKKFYTFNTSTVSISSPEPTIVQLAGKETSRYQRVKLLDGCKSSVPTICQFAEAGFCNLLLSCDFAFPLFSNFSMIFLNSNQSCFG